MTFLTNLTLLTKNLELWTGGLKTFNQPAKQADRVIAPGDGEAEPGELPSSKESSPRRWATEGTVKDLRFAKHVFD